MTQTSIRLAGEEDVSAVARLYTLFYAYNHAIQPEYCAAAVETGDYPGKTLASENGDVLVAEVDGEVVGFLHIEQETTPKYPSVVPGRYAEVVDFFVLESQRRRGIGKLLLAAAMDWARERKLSCVELLVLGNNVDGMQFYKREGFRVSASIMKYDLDYRE